MLQIAKALDDYYSFAILKMVAMLFVSGDGGTLQLLSVLCLFFFFIR